MVRRARSGLRNKEKSPMVVLGFGKSPCPETRDPSFYTRVKKLKFSHFISLNFLLIREHPEKTCRLAYK
jgi:hypothetical protein